MTAPPSVGIAITAHNRQALLDEALAAFKTHSPEFPIVVVDDGSSPRLKVPEYVTLVRHDKPQGIPAAKNASITALMALGVEHLFLFDDDTRPASPDWWMPYADGAEPHYTYCWTHFTNGRPVPKMDILYDAPDLTGYGWSMGCLLYVERRVIERVGGYDLIFSPGYEEHAEFSQRIHNAGLTTFVHQDHPGMKGMIWAGDEHAAVQRSFQRTDIAALVERNTQHRLDRIDSDAYVEYRPQRNVVLTSYYTTFADPQRGRRWPVDLTKLDPLLNSVGHKRMVLLHDLGDRTPPGVECQEFTSVLPAYQQRWVGYLHWLRQHPEVQFLWCVDATDVRMLNDPFPHVQPDTLYCGWEPKVVGCDWMRKNAGTQLPWVDANADKMLLNAGVVGGDRKTMLAFIQQMVDFTVSKLIAPLEEMSAFNRIAYGHPNLVTGPRITTVFRANTTSDPHAFWAHK